MRNDHSIPDHSGHVDPPLQHDDDTDDDGSNEVSLIMTQSMSNYIKESYEYNVG